MPDAEEIGSRITALETRLGTLDRRLYGNGQPGDVAAIKEKLDNLLSWRWRTVGGLAVLAFLGPYLARLLAQLVK
jgi:hypothetical protein